MATRIRKEQITSGAATDGYVLTADGAGNADWEEPPAGGVVDAADVTYTPAVSADWDGDADPGNVDDALDQLAERVDDLENVAPGSDANAIHDNAAGEIHAIAEKASPADADELVIEDSEDSYAKKRVQVGNLPGGSGAAHAYLGYNTVGAAQQNMTINRWLWKKISAPSAGLIFGVSFYMRQTGNSVSSFGVALAADAEGAVSTLLAYNTLSSNYDVLPSEVTGASNKTPRWLHLPLSFYVPAAGDYWVGVALLHSGSGTPQQIYYDTDGADLYYASGGRWVADGEQYAQTDSTYKYSIRTSFLPC